MNRKLSQSPWAWFGLFALALGVRLVFSAVVPHLGIFASSHQDNGLVSQGSDDYEKIARSLLQGIGYRINSRLAPTMIRNPGYVLLLTGAFKVAGEHPWVGHVLQALTAGIVLLLMARLGRPVFGDRAAFLACAFYALYPGDWIACARYVAEPLMTVFLMLALLAFRSFGQRPGITNAVLLGLFCGLMILTKSVAAYLLPFLFIWCFILWPSFRARWRTVLPTGALALAVSGAVILPWGIYNHDRSGHWVFTSTIVGYQFWDANYVNANRDRKEDRETIWVESRQAARRLAEANGIHPNPRDEWSFEFFDIHDEVAMNDLLKKHALKDIVARPAAYIWGMVRAAPEFWYLTRSRGGSLIGMMTNLPPLAIGIIGFVICRLWRQPGPVLWVGVIVYLNLVAATGVAVARYALPIMPLVFFFASAGIVTVWPKKRGQKAGVADEIVAAHDCSTLVETSPV